MSWWFQLNNNFEQTTQNSILYLRRKTKQYYWRIFFFFVNRTFHAVDFIMQHVAVQKIRIFSPTEKRLWKVSIENDSKMRRKKNRRELNIHPSRIIRLVGNGR